MNATTTDLTTLFGDAYWDANHPLHHDACQRAAAQFAVGEAQAAVDAAKAADAADRRNATRYLKDDQSSRNPLRAGRVYAKREESETERRQRLAHGRARRNEARNALDAAERADREAHNAWLEACAAYTPEAPTTDEANDMTTATPEAEARTPLEQAQADIDQAVADAADARADYEAARKATGPPKAAATRAYRAGDRAKLLEADARVDALKREMNDADCRRSDADIRRWQAMSRANAIRTGKAVAPEPEARPEPTAWEFTQFITKPEPDPDANLSRAIDDAHRMEVRHCRECDRQFWFVRARYGEDAPDRCESCLLDDCWGQVGDACLNDPAVAQQVAEVIIDAARKDGLLPPAPEADACPTLDEANAERDALDTLREAQTELDLARDDYRVAAVNGNPEREVAEQLTIVQRLTAAYRDADYAYREARRATDAAVSAAMVARPPVRVLPDDGNETVVAIVPVTDPDTDEVAAARVALAEANAVVDALDADIALMRRAVGPARGALTRAYNKGPRERVLDAQDRLTQVERDYEAALERAAPHRRRQREAQEALADALRAARIERETAELFGDPR